jgi:hypothetical protein
MWWNCLLALIAASLATSQAVGADAPPIKSADQFTVDQLIDRLTIITNKEFSLRTNIFAFDGKGKLGQGLLMLQDPAPTPAEAMTELERRGVAALPQLLAHLDDARPTKATFPVNHYSAEFDRNSRTSKTNPVGVASAHDFGEERLKINIPKDRGEYTATVGDLCFNIIGVIVNRSYESLRYRPSMVVISNSPVLCPDLREAVRNEWKGLTAEQHRKSLEADVTSPDRSGRDAGGIIALWRYYPQAVPVALEKRLEVLRYDFWFIRQFAETKLYVNPDPAIRKRLIEEFVAENGPAFRDGLILRLWQDRSHKVGDHLSYPLPSPTVQAAPDEILTSIIGEHSQDEPPRVNTVDYRDTENLIDAMQNIHSVEIDQIVWATFKKHNGRHEAEWDRDDWIAESCVKYLVHRGHDAELMVYCRRRLAEVRALDQSRVATLINILKGAPAE